MAYARTVNDGDGSAAKLITAAIGEKEHCLLNYIPAMLTALAMDQALKVVDVATEQRVAPLRKIGHKIRAAVKDYGYYLAKIMVDSDGYNAVVADFDSRTTTEQWLQELKAQEDAKNTSACLYPEAAAHLHASLALLRYVADFDAATDARLSAVLGRPVHRFKEPELLAVKRLLEQCSQIEGMKAKRTPTSEQWIKVLENKCRSIVNELLNTPNPND